MLIFLSLATFAQFVRLLAQIDNFNDKIQNDHFTRANKQ